MKKSPWMFLLAVALAASSASAQETARTRAERTLPAPVFQELSSLATSVEASGIPEEPLFAKALEGAAKGVTSNTVCPGYVRTPLVEGQIAAQASTHGIPETHVVDDVLLARTAVKRLVEPDEVADLVAYLCGPAAASITGSAFFLDGGWSAA